MRIWSSPGPRALYVFLLSIVLCAMAVPAGSASAEVFYTQDAALRLAFPHASRIEPRALALSESQRLQVQAMAQAPLTSTNITYYVGLSGADLLGYAFIETHVVRSMPETFMVVLSPAGEVRNTQILAFSEPSEYMATHRWLEQFHDRTLTPDLKLKRQIVGIAGATLSAQALTSGVRRILAEFEVGVKAGAPVAPSR